MSKAILLNTGWTFTKEGHDEPVTLPHTWNAVDGQDGGNDYYRGTCSYTRTLEKPELPNGGRAVLQFDGVAMTAVVSLNGEKVAEHKGGYSTFRADITDALHDGANELIVSVDNSDNDTVYPQKADFTFYGGIYRDVTLRVVPAAHFALAENGAVPVKVTPVVTDLTERRCEVTVEAFVVGAQSVTFTLDGQQTSVAAKDGTAKAVFTLEHYLQYACPGTQYNTYADGVYTAKSPLGPFTLQASNPFSSKPGGFMTGAGHGSTIADKYGNYWHASTMRISVNHDFERRVGLFPAGFDADGVLYCNQNFADYPHEIPAGKFDAASQQPKWMLLSYRKAVTASSTAEGSDPVNAVDEDCRRWWSAGSDQPGEWLCVDLGRDCDVRAVQVNMADEALAVDFPADSYGDDRKTRHIETRPQISHYTVETSLDGKVWTLREDVARECSNGYYEYADGIRARYIRVTGGALPYGQTLRISGLRVFGNGECDRPAQADTKAVRVDALDGKISWQHLENAQGCNVRYGIAPDKLYQSWLVYNADEVTLSTLIAGQDYYVCVDSFNENGITTGKIIKMEG